jgi:hypothetical protein
MKSIGIFSTFAEPAALELGREVVDFINTKYNNEARVPFIFSNRKPGEIGVKNVPGENGRK